MKHLLLLLFCPIILLAQTQIGDPINAQAVSDLTGTAVSLTSDGNILAVGSIGNDANGTNSGHVRFFENINGNWVETMSSINGEAAGDLSGQGVALSSDGSVVAIGSRSNDDNGEDSGHVRVFQNMNGNWVQIGENINGEGAGDISGIKLCLSSDGSVLAIASSKNNGNGLSAGHVRVYENINNEWMQIGNDIDGEEAFDRAGFSIDLSSDGTKLAVGSPQADPDGKVQVFENINSNWVQIGDDIIGLSYDNLLGLEVSLSSDANIIAVSSSDSQSGNGDFAGIVRVYKLENGNWVQMGQELRGENTADFFGVGLKLSSDGTIMATGSYGFPNETAIGRVRVYEFQEDSWIQIGQDINGVNEFSEFGRHISLSADGNLMAVGAPSDDAISFKSGTAKVYENQNGTWAQIGDDINARASSDATGAAVDISSNGSFVIIGGPNDNDSFTNAGYVWISENQNSNWIQRGWYVFGVDTDDEFGSAVQLSDNGLIFAASAPFNNDSGEHSGHVQVYQLDNEQWVQMGEDIGGESTGDESGTSISLSSDGTVIAIGAPLNDGGGADSGHVRVYQLTNDEWVQIGNDIDGDSAGDRSGQSVSLSSDATFLVVGAPGNNGSSAGQAKVYQNQNDSWVQVGSTISGESNGDNAGYSVSISTDGTTIAIGAPFNDGNGNDSGQVRIYKNQNNNWVQIGSDLEGESAGDEFGSSVSLSSDGMVLTVGAPENNGNGEASGHARVFQFFNNEWVQLGVDIDGEAAGDEAGTSVSISSDGTKVVIGSPLNDTHGPESGQVRVYDLTLLLSSDEFVLNNFSLYPNPAREQFNISLDGMMQLDQINLYNSLGQFLFSSKETSVDTSSLSTGLYFVEIETNQGKATKKLVIE